MRAREWVIAGAFREPEEYDIPTLPAWHVRRSDCGRLVFADEDGEPFIAADRPVRVRR
ncbi:hypothetical protein [Natrinema longum]|uniref:Uncharacterized protein n=1 Tax=Natrinema longum TaxID=370324 RepID=A0A8A2U5Y6_9EURY|nr:hypothetical protein [Natrinema longum]MBZ6494539.1 hypothetical protein [Natrinema longum]QSW84140.1 hypothetical protein J0X27_11810 [Natrinema longum]